MSTTSYSNVPVFQSNSPMDSIESLVAKADVTINEDGKHSTITLHVGEQMTEFLKIGTLKSLSINAMVADVSEAKALAYHEKQRTLWDQRTER